MKSIRQRLTLLLLAGLGGLVALGGAALYPAVRAMLLSEFDYALLTKVRLLTTLASPGQEGVSLKFTEQNLPEFERGRAAPEYFQVWLRDGTMQARSASLGAVSLPRRAGPLTAPLFWNLTLPDGRPGRAAGVGLLPETEETASAVAGDLERYSVTVVFARDRTRLDQMLGGLLMGIVTGGLGLLGLLALIVTRVVKAGLGPLDALTARVTGIDTGSLETRFPIRDLPPELRPIAEQLNLLLARLQEAFQRERRFTANVAHELATPIAELRSLSEAALKWKTEPEATEHLATDALEIARQMQHVVEMLLALARCEAGLQEVRREPVNLAEMLDEFKGSLATPASAKLLDWESVVTAGAIVRSDRAMLRSLLVNLLDNAMEYTPPRGKVSCRLADRPDGVALIIANTCAGLTPEELPHMSEPFWRKVAARSDRAHAGLGLALVKGYAERLGIEVRLELPRPDTFQVTVFFPPVSLA